MSLYQLMQLGDMEDCTLAPYLKMVASEEEKGLRCIRPGDVDWLPSQDWPQNVVITQDGNTVRIVALYARNPGQGAFGRMITAIAKAGLRPVVTVPSDQMREIGRAWGWKLEIAKEIFGTEEQMFPSAEWLAKRATGEN